MSAILAQPSEVNLANDDKLTVTQQSLPILRQSKGLGFLEHDLNPEGVARLDWNLLREDLSLPVAVLDSGRLIHNLEWMRRFIAAYGMRLAPHGKTTMAPKLFDLQMSHGAWGITLATAHQTLVAWQHGIRRVLMANQVVGRQNMALVSRMIEDPKFEYFCLVDSAESVHQLGAFFSQRSQRLHVLLEIGVAGGRGGIRNDKQLDAVLEAVSASQGAVVLDGVELYEGILDDEPAVRSFLERAAAIAKTLMAEGRIDRKPPILSGAGSTWFDVVAEVFSGTKFPQPVEIVLRPGCYLTHDAGFYREAHAKILERNPVAREMLQALQPALQVWAYVQSIPEETRAIIGIGKRDASFDLGLPMPAVHFRPGQTRPKPAPLHWKLTKMMDQHACLDIATGDDVRVGDMIAFDISHPCLTFDQWRTIPMIDGEYRIVDMVQTFF
jgi:D-serine deaminase-like pyridoxal phosphate-dependent protein